jgi:hypothetical protein
MASLLSVAGHEFHRTSTRGSSFLRPSFSCISLILDALASHLEFSAALAHFVPLNKDPVEIELEETQCDSELLCC